MASLGVGRSVPVAQVGTPASEDLQDVSARMAQGEARMPGREAGTVRHDWSGGTEVALSDVDRFGPVVDGAQAGTLSQMDMQATLPEGGGGGAG